MPPRVAQAPEQSPDESDASLFQDHDSDASLFLEFDLTENGEPNHDGASTKTGTSKRSRRTIKVKMTAEEKKRRNRECMRRLRHRRTILVTEMKGEIRALEQQLDAAVEMSSKRDLTKDSESKSEANQADSPVSDAEARLKKLIRQLREENYWLQKQVARKDEASTRVTELLKAREQVCYPIDFAAFDDAELAAWICNTSHFFPMLPASQVFNIVMESYYVLQENLRIVQTRAENEFPVLGWRDRRWVDNTWANFSLQKTFHRVSTHELVHKTWQILSEFEHISVLQPKAQHMKVLQRLNEHTLVIARHSRLQPHGESFCAIYLLFLMEVSDGFIIGTRSFDADVEKMHPFMCEHMFYGQLFYCFHFRYTTSGGCHLTFSGRVDNAQPHTAQYCITDILLAMLRWESHCVGPVCQIEPS
ncbi:hypothetical protein Poli38472_007270 [Pythium oligandrum]|uniref:BZIP domain-containing protein n=1 Tax=Pythium oligandrum TaxID=41045 RepID=A0A8K1C9S8_PYTOL|nr:hypothetical protein Poli38472_007270 [Pythium oligandrum]|eukprot:TMW59125.1 hypothetical protein Poli38472_007270 [Pythium oligandrum]